MGADGDKEEECEFMGVYEIGGLSFLYSRSNFMSGCVVSILLFSLWCKCTGFRITQVLEL